MSDKLVNIEVLEDLIKKIDKRNNDKIDLINEKITELTENLDTALVKTEQTLTDAEKDQVRKNLGFIGKTAKEGEQVTVNGKTYTVEPNAEIFGDYETNKAIGTWSIAEGSENVAVGRASHVEGAMNKAIGTGTHVEGVQCTATGYWSHAEGEMTTVSSYASHAEGSYTNLPNGSKRYGTASGYASHVEGGGCHASGSCSHSEGLATTASGNHSHSEGKWTVAASSAQHVEGIANIEDTEGRYIHIAGNGVWDNQPEATRSNAYTLDWDGNGWFAGNVSIGADNKQLATEEYVDEAISDCPKINEDGDLVIDGGVIADNIPKIISEDILLTISAEVLQNAVDNNIKYLESVSFVADPSKPVYADFAGTTMISTLVGPSYIEFFVADPTMVSGFALIAESGLDFVGDNPEKSLITLRVLKDLEITDLKLYQLEVNTMSSMCLEHDMKVVNSISMGRRGNIGQYSVALGGSCVASGQYSIAGGLASSATGTMSVAFGRGCSATGTAGLSTGQMCSVGQEGFATGRQSKATGRAASALGNYCVAKGTYSLAEGDNCQANGSTSHVEGYYTIAGSAYQHVQGKYNMSDTKSKYAHIVGNGTDDDARSNAHTLDWNGNGWFAGNVSIGADNKQLATEEFVNVAINNIPERFSGDYNDLTNKPEIPSIEGLATEEFVNNINDNIVESINEINTELETKASTEFVNTMLSGLRLVQMTQSEYDALPEKDSNTLYIIV